MLNYGSCLDSIDMNSDSVGKQVFTNKSVTNDSHLLPEHGRSRTSKGTKYISLHLAGDIRWKLTAIGWSLFFEVWNFFIPTPGIAPTTLMQEER